MRPLFSLAPALLLVLPVPAADPLAEALRQAVAVRKVRDSDFKGTRGALTPYRELATDGGVLVGLEVGLGGSSPAEWVVAVRPIYRVAGRDRTGPPAGRFLSDEVKRTVHLSARDEYAVAAVQLGTGRGVDGLAIRFARIDRAWLKLADSYESAWVGTTSAEQREWLTGDGQPVVGLFARLDGDAVRGLGLIFADLPRPPDPPPPPPPAPPAPSPAPKAAAKPPTLVQRPAPPPPTRSRVLPYLAYGAGVVLPLGLLVFLVMRRGAGGARRPTRLPPAPNRPTSPGLLSMLERDGDRWR